MPEKDGIEYSEDLDDMFKQKSIGPLLRKYLDKKMSPEVYELWDVMQKKADPKSQYKIFCAKNGKFTLNLASKALMNAKALVDAKNWTSKDWKDICDKAFSGVCRLASKPYRRLPFDVCRIQKVPRPGPAKGHLR